jgi:hypothetical protein
MKKILNSIQIAGIFLLLALASGCATTKNTEQMLVQAGFKIVPANTDKQAQHLKTLPADKLSVAKLNGKTYYVFPDPAHNRIYVGNVQAYQDYQQAVMYAKLQADNRVMGALGEDTGQSGDVRWASWSENTGWTGGSY